MYHSHGGLRNHPSGAVAIPQSLQGASRSRNRRDRSSLADPVSKRLRPPRASRRRGPSRSDCRPRHRPIPGGPLYKWQQTLASEKDLYLPCGVRSLTSLRQAMIIEEVTLAALARCQGDRQR